jgi:hypothetical protein
LQAERCDHEEADQLADEHAQALALLHLSRFEIGAVGSQRSFTVGVVLERVVTGFFKTGDLSFAVMCLICFGHGSNSLSCKHSRNRQGFSGEHYLARMPPRLPHATRSIWPRRSLGLATLFAAFTLARLGWYCASAFSVFLPQDLLFPGFVIIQVTYLNSRPPDNRID